MSEENQQKWPQILWMIRHGQSAGNVARDAAEAAWLPLIEIATRDADVPLSDLGQEQAEALGHWFGGLPRTQRPTVILTSPYARARATAQYIFDHAGVDPEDVGTRANMKKCQAIQILQVAGNSNNVTTAC